MDPAKKRWLNSLINHIKSELVINQKGYAPIPDNDSSEKDFTYRLLHTTGLVFGYPATSIYGKHPLSKEWNETDRARIYFAESLLAVYLRIGQADMGTPFTTENLSAVLSEAVGSIASFYALYKPIEGRRRGIDIPGIFPSRGSTLSKVEQIIETRLQPSRMFDAKYWHSSQYNAFIFLDIIFYLEWLIDPESKLYQEESLIQGEIIKTIAVSIAHSTNKNRNIENHYIQYFLENAIDRSQIEESGEIGKRTLPISTIAISKDWPAIIPQILFEYSIFTFVLDGTIDGKETEVIDQFATYLNINSETKELCLLAVYSFFSQYLNHIPYLKNRYKFNIIGSNLSRWFTSVLLKNKGKIGREVQESRELARLLWKAKNTPLTEEEQEKVKQQMSDIFLKTIPSLAIFMIPGGSLLLPILLRILPEEILLPSSFRNN